MENWVTEPKLNCDQADDSLDGERVDILWCQFFGRLSGLQVFSGEVDRYPILKSLGLVHFLSVFFFASSNDFFTTSQEFCSWASPSFKDETG